MLLRKVQHQQDIVNRILNAGQVVHADHSPRQHGRTVVRYQEGDAHSVAQIFVAPYRRNVWRLIANALQ